MKHLLLATLLVCAASAETRMPTYTLTGIVQGDPRKGESGGSAGGNEAFRDSIGATRLLYSTDGPALRAVLNARNELKLTTPILVYMGGQTTNSDDVLAIERDFRSATAMTPVAKLVASIDAKTATFQLHDPTDGEWAIKASTAEKSDVKAGGKFCFWLRLDDELMRVTAFDAATGSVTVERGFSGTQASAHAAESLALSPVYVGNRSQLGAARHSNSWPGGPDYLRYALDPAQPAAQQFKGGLVAKNMMNGYDGAWFDTFQPVPYNLCDALGRKVAYFWDFKNGKVYDFNSYLDAIKTYVRGVRVVAHKATGREPVLFANSATASYARGLKQVFNTATTHDLLDGYCFEDSYLKVKATREKGKSVAVQAAFEAVTGEKWLTNLTNHADAASSGLNGFCMAGPAGYLAAYINPTQANYDQLLRFAYASYLLTVTKERTTSFGWPMLVSANGKTGGVAPWPELLYAPVGDPVQANKIPELKLAGTPCYARAFTNGWVVVNSSSEATPVAVTVPAGYIDAVTKKPVTQLSLAGADGAVLLRAPQS